MPNRVQTLRSSVPGNVPQAATRSPGELWVNFADGHLGYIDASQTAQKLLAVRLFVSTAPYAVGDFVVYAGVLYQATAPSAAGAFTAANWTKIGTAQDLSQYLPLAGGTLTGALNLPAAAPTVATQAANKSYVDAGDATVLAAANTKLPLAGGTLTGALNGTTATFSGVAAAADPPAEDSSSKLVTTAWFNSHQPVTKENSNRIINGDMRIDQRNNGAITTPSVNNTYVIDRWKFSGTQFSKFTFQRAASGGAALATGFGYFLGVGVTSAFTPAATDFTEFHQLIEADMATDFAWGTANAQPVTLSFWANSSLTGTFSGAIANVQLSPNFRCYPFTFALPNAGVWTKIAITIPGDTVGPWVLAGNGVGLDVRFDLGSGANFRAPAGAWVSTDLAGATGAINLGATASATFNISNVKLEIGSVATPFNHQSLAKSLADCQRYYQVLLVLGSTSYSAAATGNFWNAFTLLTGMRAAPTATFAGSGYGNSSGGSVVVTSIYTFYIVGQSTAAGAATYTATLTFSAEL